MEKRFDVRVEIADVPFLIRSRFANCSLFFHDYLSDKEPLFVIDPSDDDLSRINVAFDKMDAEEGNPSVFRPLFFLENNAIHDLLAEKMVAHHVLLIHGSALCMDGIGHLFTAKSGTGKSTHARLWREAFGDRVWMINDDKPMLRITENAATVYGTPWDGKHHLSRNASAPLKAIYKLERAEHNCIEPLTEQEAYETLLIQCFRSKQPAVMMQILTLEKQLLNAVSFYKLGCNTMPDAAWVAWRK